MKIRDFLQSHKFLVCVILLSLVMALSAVALLFKAVAGGLMTTWLFIVLVIGIIAVPFIAFIVRKKKLSIQALTVIISAVLALLYLFVFPPNTVPDEPLHYSTAYHISNQMMFKFGDEDYAMRMRAEDDAFVKSTSHALSAGQYSHISKNNYLFSKNNEEIIANRGYILNKNIVYVAPAIGITLGRICSLSGYWTYQLGRLFNFLSFLAFVYFAIKLMPFGKIALAAIAMLPINLHIMASVSYDVFSVGGILLLFAYIMNLWYGEKKIGLKQLGFLALMIILVVPQKAVYIGVAALVLLLPKEKFANPKLHLLFKCLLGVIALASIFILQAQNSSKLVSDSASTGDDVAGYSLQYVFAHPGAIAKMLFYTICYKTDFYIKSLTAYFGWFQIEAPWLMAVPTIIVVLLAFMRKKNEPNPDNMLSKLYCIILFLIVFLAIELLLLLDHTPFGSVCIEGVQGRYFIPALPLVFLVLRNNVITVSEKMDDAVLVLMPALNILTLLFCVFRIMMF